MAKLSEAHNKILGWFFSFPDREFSLSDLAEELNISKATANRIVLKLKDKGFLNIEVIGRIWRISCNKNHKYNYSRKVSYNLTNIFESSILEQVHKKISNPISIILFGSYRKGDDNENSDVDIAVEVLDGKELKIISLDAIHQLGHRKNVPVTLHIFSRNKVDLNLFSNIANGIVLEGFLEVRP